MQRSVLYHVQCLIAHSRDASDDIIICGREPVGGPCNPSLLTLTVHFRIQLRCRPVVQVPDSPCFDMDTGGCRSPVSLLDMGRASPSLPIDIPSVRDLQDAQMPSEYIVMWSYRFHRVAL